MLGSSIVFLDATVIGIALRRVFFLGVAGFGLTSLLCALPSSILLLCIFRAAQGAFAGALIEAWLWRLIVLINVPLVLVTLLLIGRPPDLSTPKAHLTPLPAVLWSYGLNRWAPRVSCGPRSVCGQWGAGALNPRW